MSKLWSETIRTDANVEYMLFPRLLALAERGWAPAPWTPAYEPGASYQWQDARVDQARLGIEWQGFASRVAAQNMMLDRMGIAYRIAPPGGRIIAGKLHANTEFAGTQIQYRANAGAWRDYTAPVAVSGAAELRTLSPDGKRTSRTVRIEPER